MDLFINSGIDNGINNYLLKFNNQLINPVYIFEYYVIALLVTIYGEINIINPYKLRNKITFINNLKLYGMPEKKVQLFLDTLENYNKWLHSSSGIKKNNYTNIVEQLLMEMIFLKNTKVKVSDQDILFYDQFFSHNLEDITHIQKVFSVDEELIPTMWKRKRIIFKKTITLDKMEPEMLSESQYRKYGLTLKEIFKLSNDAVERINAKIIESESENNSTGGRLKNKPFQLVLTSGSGFTDTIVLLSIIATEIMIALIIAFSLMR